MFDLIKLGWNTVQNSLIKKYLTQTFAELFAERFAVNIYQTCNILKLKKN